ncbi:hypothetical protein P3W33_06480 [Luteibacter sp. PPL552]
MTTSIESIFLENIALASNHYFRPLVRQVRTSMETALTVAAHGYTASTRAMA